MILCNISWLYLRIKVAFLTVATVGFHQVFFPNGHLDSRKGKMVAFS